MLPPVSAGAAQSLPARNPPQARLLAVQRLNAWVEERLLPLVDPAALRASEHGRSKPRNPVTMF